MADLYTYRLFYSIHGNSNSCIYVHTLCKALLISVFGLHLFSSDCFNFCLLKRHFFFFSTNDCYPVQIKYPGYATNDSIGVKRPPWRNSVSQQTFQLFIIKTNPLHLPFESLVAPLVCLNLSLGRIEIVALGSPPCSLLPAGPHGAAALSRAATVRPWLNLKSGCHDNQALRHSDHRNLPVTVLAPVRSGSCTQASVSTRILLLCETERSRATGL